MTGRRKAVGVPLAKLALAVTIIGSADVVFPYSAHSKELDDALEAYLAEVCLPSKPTPTGLELLCFAINAPGGDPDSFVLISTGNLGSVGTLEDTAIASATQEQTARKQRQKDSAERKGSSAYISGDRWGVNFSAQYSDIDRKPTALEQGFDAELYGASIGLDYLALDRCRVRVGATVAYTRNDTDLDDDGGGLEAESVSAVLHANYAPNENFNGTVYAGYGRQTYETRRIASFSGFPVAGLLGGEARGDFDGDQTVAGLFVGYDEFFDATSLGSGSVGILSSVSYVRSHFDAYSETGDAGLIASGLAMSFESQTARSLTTSVGLRGSVANEFLSPFVFNAQIEYVHEFEGASRTISSSLVAAPDATFLITTDPADQNYFRSSLGVSARISDSVRIDANYNRRLADSLLDVWSINGGLRIEF